MNPHFDLLETLKHESEEYSTLLSHLKYELRKSLYYYGDQFKRPKEGAKRNLLSIRELALPAYIWLTSVNPNPHDKNILSSSAYTYDKDLENLGYKVFRAPWSPTKNTKFVSNWQLFTLARKIQRHLDYSDFDVLISEEFLSILIEFQNQLRIQLKECSFDALVVPSDMPFFERLTIALFRELKKPSFILAHGGMPSLYDGVIDNQTDYVGRWGQKQVDAYVNMGYDRKKFFVTGHPLYLAPPTELRFSLDDVLVLTKSMNGACPLETNHLDDRGSSILYLHFIQTTLTKLGIEKVRLRPHPSENPNWYAKFTDSNFFEIDSQPLNSSLAQSSLVVGPTSTSIIDAMANGVSYHIFEPVRNGRNIQGYPVTPPLDGKDSRIPVSRNQHELYIMIKNKQCVDKSVYSELIANEYDLTFVKDII